MEKRLVGRPSHRWKISYDLRCDVTVGIDLAQGAYKPRMIICPLCNVGSVCTCWVTVCFMRKQYCGLDDQGIILQFLGGNSCLSSSKYPDDL